MAPKSSVLNDPLYKEYNAAKKNLPAVLQPTLTEIITDPSMSDPLRFIQERMSDFPTPETALLAGVGMDRKARNHLDVKLDELWSRNGQALPSTAKEVVVGAGLHAAIYCAVRVATGHPPPLVLEKNERAGGAFAMSLQPSFYLNSRNRPGPLSIPGDMEGSLNTLPGSMIQPSFLGGEEYQTNDMLAWVIRVTLGMFARVVTGVDVSRIVGSRLYRRDDDNNKFIRADRIILATGLGDPRRTVLLDSPRVLSFPKFMSMMDTPFPLRGMKRVAVVGRGDSANTAVEALTGQGPAPSFSVAGLDWVERIDWHGCPFSNCDDWVGSNRSRYKAIGRLLPGGGVTAQASRVRPLPLMEENSYAEGYDSVSINFVPYDAVIDCTGFQHQGGSAYGPSLDWSLDSYNRGNRMVARKNVNSGGFIVGPAALIQAGSRELRVLKNISENTTSMFRYAPRTAALASILP